MHPLHPKPKLEESCPAYPKDFNLDITLGFDNPIN